jgi:transcriptional regulator with XRE-family HTH domain
VTHDAQAIGMRLKNLRETHGLTQQQLGIVIDLDETAISKIEHGKRGLAAAELAQLCEHFEIRSDVVLFGEAKRPPAGVLLRADVGADVRKAVKRVEEAFADYRYVKALIES